MQTPTIGRKVWYWSPRIKVGEDARQAFDATVVYVNSRGQVNLACHNHNGAIFNVTAVELRDPATDTTGDFHGKEQDGAGYATWMPYQKAQHDKQV